jgi:hypothetical protein
MMFDVGVRLGYNASGKAMNRYYRVHDTLLSVSIRKAQDAGQYVFSIIPLFRKKEDKEWPIHKPDLHFSQAKLEEVREQYPDAIEDRAMIDPHGM